MEGATVCQQVVIHEEDPSGAAGFQFFHHRLDRPVSHTAAIEGMNGTELTGSRTSPSELHQTYREIILALENGTVGHCGHRWAGR